MLWEIRGMRGGKAIRAKVAADSEESARAKATSNGVAVSSVTLLEDPSAAANPAAPQTSPKPANIRPRAPSTAVQTPAQPILRAPPRPSVPTAPAAGNLAGASQPSASPAPFAQPIQYAVPPQYVPGGPGVEKFSGLSIASLVCGCVSAVLLICIGLVGWTIGGIAGIVGLVMGMIAWKSAKAMNNNKDRNMAIAGTFTSMGALVLHLIFIVLISGALLFILLSAPKPKPASAPAPSVAVKVTPPMPTASQLASKLQQIDNNTWKSASSTPVDLLATMRGHNISNDADGSLIVGAGAELTTAKSYRMPTRFRIVLLTDDRDTRIRYGQTELIFNWDGGIDELRVDGGPADRRHKPGAGRLPYAQWVAIEMVVHSDEMIIYVDGSERYRAKANFYGVGGPLTLKAHGGVLKVKSVSVLPE